MAGTFSGWSFTSESWGLLSLLMFFPRKPEFQIIFYTKSKYMDNQSSPNDKGMRNLSSPLNLRLLWTQHENKSLAGNEG